MRSLPARVPVRFAGTALLLAAAAAGCGEARKGVVSGKVEFGGRPVQAGTVSFFASGNRSSSAPIINGKYKANDVPYGEVTVTVNLPEPSAASMAAKMGVKTETIKAPEGLAKMPEDMVPPPVVDPAEQKAAKGKAGGMRGMMMVPDKYKDKDSSPLKFNVGGGEQTFDITLTP